MTADTLAVIDQEPENGTAGSLFPAATGSPFPGTALQTNATRQMMPDEWVMLKELAVTLEAAGQGTGILPKGISNRYQIAAILKKGRELGFAEMYSLEQIAMVNGKPVIQGQALTALIKSRHGPSAITKIESTEQTAVYELRRAGAEPTRFQFTIEDAKRAGLLAKKGPWEQYPRVMLKWRCIAEGAREYFADTIAGLYLPDELGVPITVTAGGEVEIDREQWQPEPTGTTGSPFPGQQAFDQPSDAAPLPSAPESTESWQVKTRRAVAGALSVSREGSQAEKSFTTDVRQYMTHHFNTMNISRLTDDQLASLVMDKFPSLVAGLPGKENTEANGGDIVEESVTDDALSF
jgi:hypothetical protein